MALHTFKTIEDKYWYIKAGRSGASMEQLCQAFGISRSGYCAWRKRKPRARMRRGQALARALVGLHGKYPAPGLDSLYHMLRPDYGCSRKRVHRLMRRNGIHSVRTRACRAATNSRHSHPIAPNLLQRKFSFDRPNQAWVGDVTCIPTSEGWLYLATIKDLCTKKVVGYAFSSRIDTQLTPAASDMAVRREKPANGLVFHSDRGVQYAAAAYRKRLSQLCIRQSMFRKVDPYDNAVAENFFSCLKCELIHLHRFDTRAAAHNAVFAYIEGFYNSLRPHSAIGWIPPNIFATRFSQTAVS